MTVKLRLLALLVFAVGVSSLFAGEMKEQITLEGTLVSAHCYLSNNSATGDDMGGVKACGSGCLKQGKPAGLLTKDKVLHVLVAPSLLLASFVGQEVRVTGVDYKGVVSVKKAEVQKDGKWEEIDLKFLVPKA